MKSCKKVSQKSLLDYSEVQNFSDTAFGDGEKIGIEKGKVEEKQAIARGILAENLPFDLIIKLTGLTAIEI